MKGPEQNRFLIAIASIAALTSQVIRADQNHAAEDEFAAAAAALAPKFDPKRDAVTIQKLLAQRQKDAEKAQAQGIRKKISKKQKNLTTKALNKAKADVVALAAATQDSQGSWGAVIPWTPHIPVTAAALPNGKLLTFASNQRTTFPSGPEFTYAAIWDPATGQFTEVNNTRHDMFCGGTAMLPDGRVVVNGGRATTKLSSIFDWNANSWAALPNMNDPRWYNPSVALPDGGVFTVSGSGGSNTAERWDEATGWRRLSGIGWSSVTAEPGYINIWHPFLMVAPNGKLFHFGPTDTMHWVDVSGTGSMTNSGQFVPGTHYPKEGAWVMYNEGRILVAGGGANTTSGSDSTTGTSTKVAYTVDLRGANPVVANTNSMTFARQFANTVILPNGEVMVIGGNGGAKFSDAASVLTPEIWNPTTGAWRTVANHVTPRNYHSVALLLPDGRVWSGGGGLGGNAADHRDAEIFTPPSLYTSSGTLAARPVISSMPGKIGIGTRFNVTATAGLSRFTMIRLSSITHSVNTDLRFLEASFSETTPGNYQITANANINALTPGYWMLFGLNSSGVHSVAKIFQVDPQSVVTLAAPGSQTGYVGEAASLALSSTGPTGAVITYSATGLPAGLNIQSSTGLISGIPTTTGSYTVNVTATDGITVSNQSFTWTISPLTRSHKFAGFSNANGLAINGSAAVVAPSLRITPATANLAGSAWVSQSFPVRGNTSFATRFVFRQTGTGDGGDGMTFVVQGTGSTALGVNGGGLGYQNIASSLAVEFDAYAGTGDPNANHVGVLSAGNVNTHLATFNPAFDLEDNADHTAWVEYDGTTNTLRVYLSQTVTTVRPQTPVITLSNIDLPALVGQQAWFGFTGATGGAINAHEIASWDLLLDANKLPSLSLPPQITNPGAQIAVTGTALNLQIVASDPENEALTYSASGLPGGLTIQPNNGLISGTPNTTGTFNPTVSVSDGTNAAVTAQFQWTVNAPFEVTPLTGTAVGSGASTTFTAGSTGGKNVRYKWNFGDGTPETSFSISPTISHVFTNPGRYLVTVTVTDDTGRTKTSSFYQGVSAPATATAPRSSSSIIVENRSSGNARVWVVNPDADTVAAIDAVTRAKLAEIPVGTSPRTLAVAPDGRIWVACATAGTVSILNPNTFAVAQTLTLPRGSRPFGIVFDPQGSAAWLTLEQTGRLLKLNPSTGAVLADIAVGKDVRHLSVNAAGSRAFVSRFITPPLPGEATPTVNTTGKGGEIVAVDTTNASILKTIILQHSDLPDTSISGRGIPNYLGAPVITPDGLSAWIPSKQDNIKRGTLRDGQPLTHDSAVRPIASRVNLTTMSEDYNARVDFNDAGTPTAVCHDPSGIYTFVALEGSRAVALVDTWNHQEITRFPAGRAPQGLAVSPDGKTLFVQNFMDRSVTAHDLSGLLNGGSNPPSLLGSVATVATEKLAANVLLGKQHFYDTKDNRLALQEYISCASCHADGGQDGRVWDFTGFGEGLRNTITLHGQAGQGPLHWTGNFDEVQDFEGQIRSFAGGTGLIANGTPHPTLGTSNAGRSADLDALAAYLGSLTKTDESPARQDAATLPANAAAGRTTFITQNCASCHGGPEFTRSALGRFENVGTIQSSSGQRMGGTLTGFDIPTLRGLWATGPYLHNGSAATVADAIRAHTNVSLAEADIANLSAYLLNVDESITSAPEVLTELSETFTTNGIDAAKWSVGTPYGNVFAPADPLISVVQSGGKLVVTPRTNVSTEGYNGVVSNDLINLQGAAVSAEINPAGGTADTWLALGTGSNSFLVIGREGSVLWLEQMVNGARDVTLFDYNATNHRFWRIRHDAATDRIHFELSADASNWTSARVVNRAIAINAMRIELAAGTFRAESAPGTAIFDNVTLTRPGVPPVIVSFTADSADFTQGGSTTLRWTVNPGSAALTSLTLNGADVKTLNSLQVTPAQTTTYVLSAASTVGTVNASVKVTVRPPQTGNTYAEWAAAYGGTGNLTNDGDGDSYPEGLEYALGLHPSNGSTFVSTLPNANPSLSRGVRLERSVSNDGSRRFDLVFTRPVTPLPDIGYGYWLEYSYDMENWGISANLNGLGSSGIPDILQIIVTDLGDGTEEVRAGFRYTPSFFVRLAVYLPGGTVRSAPFGWLNRSVHYAENLIAPPFAREAVHGGNFTWSSPLLTDAAAAWTPGQWAGHFAHITSGPAEGTMLRVSGNTANTLSFGGESQALLDRLASGPAGSYVIRPCHTIAGLFGANNRDGLVSGDASTADLIELLNPDSSFTAYHYDGNWKAVAAPGADASTVVIPPTDALFLRRRAFVSSDVHLFGEVVLGKRVAPVRAGFSLPGTWNPVEKANIDTLGANDLFNTSPTPVMDSNIYLEIGTGGGLYPHYQKTGAGWRFVQGDSTPAGTAAFAPAASWLFLRWGGERLWVREQPFNYTR
jgi:YVTN family beta-propeller protein